MAHHCISHVKDVDGVASAALVLAAKGGTFRLTDYDDLLKEIDAIPASATSVTICDLGTNASNFPEFVGRLAALAKRMPVTYIDHHYLTEEAKQQVIKTGVELHARHQGLRLHADLPHLQGEPARGGAAPRALRRGDRLHGHERERQPDDGDVRQAVRPAGVHDARVCPREERARLRVPGDAGQGASP